MLLEPSAMASNKPRCFQVVPLPCVFSRGRWECWDYKEGDVRAASKEKEILVFDKNVSGQQPSASALTNNSSADAPPATMPLSSLVTNPPITHMGSSSASVSPTATSTIVVEPLDTLVVTSVAQAKQDGVLDGSHFVSDSVRLHNSPLAMTSTTSGESVLLPSVDQVTIIGASDSLARPTDVISGVDAAKDLSKLEDVESNNIALLATGGTNSVAIDNKIEQAMDLVKKHLTFAVREEVEELKSTITELESKVSMLANENQLLKQYAPSDIVANLASIVHARTTAANQSTITTLSQSTAHTDALDATQSTPLLPQQQLPRGQVAPVTAAPAPIAATTIVPSPLLAHPVANDGV